MSLCQGMKARENVIGLVHKAMDLHHSSSSSHATQACALSILINSSDKDKLTFNEIVDVCVEMIFFTVEGIYCVSTMLKISYP